MKIIEETDLIALRLTAVPTGAAWREGETFAWVHPRDFEALRGRVANGGVSPYVRQSECPCHCCGARTGEHHNMFCSVAG